MLTIKQGVIDFVSGWPQSFGCQLLIMTVLKNHK